VTVLGAGVIGLSTAVCLAEAGLSVAVHAAEPPDQTTSVAAGAIWGPHLVGDDERVGRWAETTRAALFDLTAEPFVHVCRGLAAHGPAAGQALPEVALGAPDVTVCPAADVPPGYAVAWRFSQLLVAMPEYLDYLRQRHQRAGGGPIVTAAYPTLADAVRAADTRVLVNCSGSGARAFVPDASVVPYRGQVVVVANPGITEFFVGIGGPLSWLTYAFPHGDRVLLGGTEQEGDSRREPDPATADRIIAACAAVVPALSGARVLAHRVGLRPFRPSVRLEREAGPDGTVVVHNYGHGGSGVTLAWGCAQDAAALVVAALDGRG